MSREFSIFKKFFRSFRVGLLLLFGYFLPFHKEIDQTNAKNFLFRVLNFNSDSCGDLFPDATLSTDDNSRFMFLNRVGDGLMDNFPLAHELDKYLLTDNCFELYHVDDGFVF